MHTAHAHAQPPFVFLPWCGADALQALAAEVVRAAAAAGSRGEEEQWVRECRDMLVEVRV